MTFGRITESKYLAMYIAGGVASGVLGILVGWVARSLGVSWDLELSGAILCGGAALSAQVAKGRVRSAHLRTAMLVASGLIFGAAAFHWIRIQP